MPARTIGGVQRLDSLLLASIGVLLVHQVAYTASALLGYETSVAHGHMALAWFGGSIAVLCALARSITQSLKRRRHDATNVLTLFAAIAGGYLLLEQFERAVDGYGTFSLFSEPVFWLGMAVAPLVALALHWSVRSVARLVAFVAVTARTSRWQEPQPLRSFGIALGITPVSLQLASVVSRRGPPTDLNA